MWLWKNPGLLIVQGEKKEEKTQDIDDTTTGLLQIVLASHIKRRWTHGSTRHKEILVITREWNACMQYKELILAC